MRLTASVHSESHNGSELPWVRFGGGDGLPLQTSPDAEPPQARCTLRLTIAGVVVALTLAYTIMAAGEPANDLRPVGTRSDPPMEITAKKFIARNTPSGPESIFDGTVEVKQEDITLTCDRLAIVYEGKKGAVDSVSRTKQLKDIQTIGSIKTITASGNVKIVQHQRKAEAGKAVYDSVKRTITLTEGPPRIWTGPSHMKALAFIIYLDEDSVQSVGDKDHPVEGTIVPRK